MNETFINYIITGYLKILYQLQKVTPRALTGRLMANKVTQLLAGTQLEVLWVKQASEPSILASLTLVINSDYFDIA